MPGGLTRVAGSGGNSTNGDAPPRRAHLQPGRRDQQGHVGARVGAREALRVLARRAARRSPRSIPKRRCRRAPPRTCSGSAVTPSAPRRWRASCAPRTTGRDFQGQGSNPAGTECLEVLLGAITRVSSTYPGLRRRRRHRPRSPRPAPSCSRSWSTTTGAARSPTRSCTCSAPRARCATNCRPTRGSSSATLDREIRDLRMSDPERPMVAQHTLGRIVQSLLALSGLAGESMVRDPGWRFMDAGRRIERALQLAALLRATVTVERSTATDSLLVESVLIAAESIITYRRRYRSHAQLETLLDLLVFDADNPRSLAYQLDQLAADVRLMPKLDRGPRLSEPQRLVLETSTALGLADSALLARAQDDGIRTRSRRVPHEHPGVARAHRRRDRHRPLRPPVARSIRWSRHDVPRRAPHRVHATSRRSRRATASSTCSRATRRARCAGRRRCASSPSRTTTGSGPTSSGTAPRTSPCSSRTRSSRSPPRAWST